MQVRSKILLFSVLVCILLGCAADWALGSILTWPTNAAVPAPIFPARLVHIESAPGIYLAGTFWPGINQSAPAILLLHGNGSNRDTATETALWLHNNQYAVLAIDFRGHGESSPATKSFGLFEADDARAAFDWLHAQYPKNRIGVIGYSLGGAASLIGRQGVLPADAFVLEAVYPDIRHAIYHRLTALFGRIPAVIMEPLLSFQSLPRFGVWPWDMSPIHALKNVHVPIMIVGGASDVNTPPDETRAMYDVVNDHAELHILPGIGHDKLGGGVPPDLRASLLAFLDRCLKVPHDRRSENSSGS